MTAPATSSVTVRMAISGTIVERRDADEVLDIVSTRLQAATARGLAVGSVNLDHLHHFRRLGATGPGGLEWLLLADGAPVALRGRVLTSQPWPRVTGADLLPRVLELASARGCRVGFFGGTPHTHELLRAALARQYPSLNIAGMWAPDPEVVDKQSPLLAAQIRAAGTDILVVSLGKPRQEHWVDRYGTATGARIFLPFGGAIDFMAGKTQRAPDWMRRVGLEWLHRLTREPRRLFRRYLVQGPVSLLRAGRAQLIYYPGVYYAGEPAPVAARSQPEPADERVVTLPTRRAVAEPVPHARHG
ncbi:WecB/TagA/CpsF family glycosyltransferase [Mycobacterium sp. MYCO198283]|uniref:WecB/TagA/CpsF family glycosyltransferase n=1 Tax=Mycobacterium sp. MYCO198283 TaxID=2883505 RepID=UPI001E43D372|nr:WecB/TagA/CpsF family glycosyltransferase [Mycobacterium sp. MYCO198283]MCG5433892.1 WecB/TagA/CpsF family glycosyltransferase [Mycobacterium sp. MYCO198283]